jgi:hypothetical protein
VQLSQRSGELHQTDLQIGKDDDDYDYDDDQATKAYWGVEVQLHSFFDLGIRWK